jgi:RHS repeat-associated protein
MRSALAADLDCEQSLEAMRHAFRASKFARRNYVEIDAGVVHALLNARYYDSARGQFLSEDPVFLTDPKRQNLKDPQSFNTYTYSEGNPINRSDPTGLYSLWQVANGQATWGQYWGDVNDGAQIMGQNPNWNFAFNHPVATGMLAVGPLSGVAAASGAEIIPAFNAATYAGVGAAYAAKQAFAALVYSALTAASLSSIPDNVNSLRQANPSQPWSYFPTALSLTTNLLPSLAGGYLGAISDVYQFAGLLTQTLSKAASSLYSSSKGGGSTIYLNSSGRPISTPGGGSGGYVISNGQTPVGRDKGGAASYCLGVCKQ